MTLALSLLVLRAANPARTRRFYEALGLRFANEQHGDGPLHCACVLGDTVLEIYPMREGADLDRRDETRLGVRVDDLEAALVAAVAIGATILREPTAASPRAVLGDPDGRVVELTT